MRAAVIADSAVAVHDKPDPVPGTRELLVRVRAAGVNGADLLQRRGRYPAPPGSPEDIPGLELAGEVVGIGEGASRFRTGDRVMAIVGGGAQAELVTLHERVAMPVPEPLGWEEAGGLPEVFATAYDALFVQAGLAAGERLLVNGAAGGVGTAAIQLARRAGATVVASVRTAEVAEKLRELGADEVVEAEAGSADVVHHGPFHVVLELVGAANLTPSLKALDRGGRVCFIGVGAGAKTELNALHVMGKRAAILGSTLRAEPLEMKAGLSRQLERHVLPGFGRDLRVPVERSFGLDQVHDAYELFAAGGKVGKIVLTM